jgi:hypothetical protein
MFTKASSWALGRRWRATDDDQLRKEPLMELQMRLNVLAVLLSLGFLAAIIFGMV